MKYHLILIPFRNKAWDFHDSNQLQFHEWLYHSGHICISLRSCVIGIRTHTLSDAVIWKHEHPSSWHHDIMTCLYMTRIVVEQGERVNLRIQYIRFCHAYLLYVSEICYVLNTILDMYKHVMISWCHDDRCPCFPITASYKHLLYIYNKLNICNITIQNSCTGGDLCYGRYDSMFFNF